MRLRVIHILYALLCSVAAFGWDFTGRVTDEAGIPMSGVLVVQQMTNNGTETDTYGRFSLPIKEDTVVVSVYMAGYEEQMLRITQNTGYQRIKLMEISYELEGVETVAQRKQVNSATTIDVSDLRFAPSAAGGGIDALVQGQAGVVQSNELSQQYSVRGGSYDENAVYVNGIEVFRPQLVRSAQQEGLAFVNTDLVKNVSFSSGGFSAEMGDKMSSVLDIQYRKPERAIEGSLMGSLMGASAYIGSHTGKFTQIHGLRYKNSAYLFKDMETDGDYNTSFIDYQTCLTWDVTPKCEISFLGNISSNKYAFNPTKRETSFGTMSNVKTFTVYFDGGERDRYNSYFGNLSLKFLPVKRMSLSFLGTAYHSDESVNYDIQGEYWLDELSDSQAVGVDVGAGVGSYHEHARDRLLTSIFTISHVGDIVLDKNTLKWGLTYQGEKIKDKISEWEMRDSAGYAIPMRPDMLSMYSNLLSDELLTNSRVMAFLQNTFASDTRRGRVLLNTGVRLNYWTFNKEVIISPRVTLAFFPEKAPKWGFRFAVGRYCQSPFYKELRDTVVRENGNVDVILNKNIKSPRSTQAVVSADRYFTLWKRPFKFTTEFYGKYIDRVIPYNIDNVKIVYDGVNNGDGYVIGADAKLFGEFVPGVDSWISLSLMRAKENIYGDGADYIASPNERLYNVSFFFQDQFPGVKQLKLNLRMNFADGFNFGPPKSERKNAVFKSPAYRRVDVGLTWGLEQGRDRVMQKAFLKYLKGISLTVDCLNLFDIENVSSYYWITDAGGTQYAVPNYLTGRTLNAKLVIDF